MLTCVRHPRGGTPSRGAHSCCTGLADGKTATISWIGCRASASYGTRSIPRRLNHPEVRRMNNPLYRQAFDRIRAEYLEMPGMLLSPAQVQRLSGVEIAICQVVLDDLVQMRFLQAGSDGRYARDTENASRLRPAKADSKTPAVPISRRPG